jgi:hypothetical protein
MVRRESSVRQRLGDVMPHLVNLLRTKVEAASKLSERTHIAYLTAIFPSSMNTLIWFARELLASEGMNGLDVDVAQCRRELEALEEATATIRARAQQ